MGLDIEYEFEWITSLSEITRQIEKELFDALKKEFGVDIISKISVLKEGIQQIVRKYIERNQTFISVCKDEQGKLWAELGLPMDRRMWAANEMVDIIANGIDVQFSIEGRSGMYDVEADVTWSNERIRELMSMNEAMYPSINKKRGTSFTIPWLEWLLSGGTKTLVSGFHIVYGNFPKKQSRSGMALMKDGGAWSMPFGSFDIDDNFVTESLQETHPEIIQFIMQNFGGK